MIKVQREYSIWREDISNIFPLRISSASPHGGDADNKGGHDNNGDVDSLIRQGFLLSRSILLLQPDDYSCWNVRKRMILYLSSSRPSESSVPADIVREELDLTLSCLARNPKSYSTWHHRRWMLSCDMAKCGDTKAIWMREMALLARLFSMDSRNCNILQHTFLGTACMYANMCAVLMIDCTLSIPLVCFYGSPRLGIQTVGFKRDGRCWYRLQRH